MDKKSYFNKFLFIMSGLSFLVIVTFFFISKGNINANVEKIELINNVNAKSYDLDMYIYKLDNGKIYTSEFFYNDYYLANNDVTFEELYISDNTKFYLKTLSNTEVDIDNIKISYDSISVDEFEFLVEKNNLLKVNIWLDKNDNCKNVLLYSSNNMELVFEEY